MSKPANSTGSALSREAILGALQSLSDELARQGLVGELCLFGGTVMVLAFSGRVYPANRIPVKTQYLIEGLFEEGKV